MTGARVLRAAAVALIAAAVGACSSATPPTKQRSKEFFSEAEYGAASPRIVALGKPVPKGGGRQMLGEPYRVAGKTYIPRDNPDYSATGLASWYGEAFHGRLTANGEVYDIEGLTAAHPTMPLPSYARVTNVTNGRSIIVRVNDRGPFARGRIMDVSAKVADILGFRSAGTAKVHVEYVGPARMDGLDYEKLLASYRNDGGKVDDSGFGGVMLAAGTPQPRLRPAIMTFQPEPAPVVTPAAMPSASDPLAPLILSSAFISGYAAPPQETGAQRAVNAFASSALATDDLQSALDRAAAERARQLGLAAPAPAAGPAIVVRLGTFGDPDNAARIVKTFAAYGRTTSEPTEANGRQLLVVSVMLSDAGSADAVIAAAARIGLKGAFVAR